MLPNKNSLPSKYQKPFLQLKTIEFTVFPLISPLWFYVLSLSCVFVCMTEREGGGKREREGERGPHVGRLLDVSMVIKQDVVSDLLPRQA